MHGLVFDPRPARLALAGAVSRVRPSRSLSAPGPLSLRELADPVPPGPGWLTLRPLHAGVCGSDITQATLQADWDNPLSGLISFPHVMGHEIVARVLGAGAGFEAGEVVVVNPWLGCLPRGLAPCPACAAGRLPLCRHTGEPIPGIEGSGIHTGNIRGLPGGMGTRMVAHASQLHRLPAGLDPRAGVLADPLAVGLHAAEQALAGPDPDGAGPGRPADRTVAVLGAGTVGLAVTAGLRCLGVRSVTTSCAWPYQPALVGALGARAVGARPAAVLSAVAGSEGARMVRPWRGLPWLIGGGGADAVVDAVGSAATLELALAIVRPGGTVVRVGVGRARRAQATLAYFKEVSMVGSNGYRVQDLERSLAMLASGEAPWPSWLTHRFPLREWRRAFRTAAEPQRHGAVKVSLDIAPASPPASGRPAEVAP